MTTLACGFDASIAPAQLWGSCSLCPTGNEAAGGGGQAAV